jgi:hypothetical protein
MLAAAAACSSPTDPNYSQYPGGTVDAKVYDDAKIFKDGSAMAPVDAAPDATPTTITANVCPITDPRTLMDCGSGAGLMVALDGATATTGSNGDFTIALPTSSSPMWSVSGASLVTSLTGYTGDFSVPAMPTNVYTSLASATDVTLISGTGGVIAHVLSGSAEEAGALVTIGSNQTYYAGTSSSTNWSSSAVTTSYGAAWIPNVTPGEVAITTGTTTVYASVVADQVTFVTIRD